MLKFLKEMQLGWHGLSQKLDDAIGSDDRRGEMSKVLLRNVYVDAEEGGALDGAEEASLWLADYLLAQAAHHAQLPSDAVLRGAFTWAPPPPLREASV